jgi:hypothetical protein
MLRTVNVREETSSTLAKIRWRPSFGALFALHPVVDPALVCLPPAPFTHSSTSDFGYAFEIIHEFLETFHAQIKQDPFSVLLLRATFLKIVR